MKCQVKSSRYPHGAQGARVERLGQRAWYNPRVNGQLVSAAALLKRCKVESAADADLLRGAASSSLGNINSLEAKEHLRPPATTFWLNLPPFAQETRAKATTGHRQC